MKIIEYGGLNVIYESALTVQNTTPELWATISFVFRTLTKCRKVIIIPKTSKSLYEIAKQEFYKYSRDMDSSYEAIISKLDVTEKIKSDMLKASLCRNCGTPCFETSIVSLEIESTSYVCHKLYYCSLNCVTLREPISPINTFYI